MAVIFKIYLILVFVSISVFTHDKRQWTSLGKRKKAFQTAICIAHCEENPNCREECRSDEAALGNKNISLDALFLKDNKNGTKFSGPANFNATLHCKDIDVIRIKHNRGIWIIEESKFHDDSVLVQDDRSVAEDDRMRRIQVTDATTTISSFTNLSAGTFYRYKARRVMKNELISESEISPWFQTFPMDHRSEEVKNIELTSLKLDEMNPSRVRADITFQPGSGDELRYYTLRGEFLTSNRSCSYEVISFNEDQGLTIGNIDSSQDFRFSLHDLEYDANMSVFVSSRNMGNSGSSGNVSIAFVTPSCLELHRNVIFCAPDQVRGFHASKIYHNVTFYDIIVGWDQPEFLPDNYTIQIQSVDYYGNKESSTLTSILPGNTTEALLTLEIDDAADIEQRQRIISIIAESPGGTSPQSWIHVILDENDDKLFPEATTDIKIYFHDGLIAIPSIAVVAILLLGFAYYVCRLRSSKNSKKDKRDDVKSDKYCQNLNEVGRKKSYEYAFYPMGKPGKFEYEKKDPLLLPMKDKFEIRPCQLTIKDIVGSGASGIVRLGSLRDSKNQTIDVAIKMLKDNPNTDDLKNFQQEISIMKSAGHHPNIVSIIGCCTLQIVRPMLIVEYCSRGDLQTYLRAIWQETMSRALERRARCKIAFQDDTTMKNTNNNAENMMYWIETHQNAITNQLYDIQEAYALGAAEDQVTVADLLNFARQVASGMEFLSSNRIIHRDLAARNVLLCADKTVKISDFGLSRDIYQENVYKKQGNGRLPLKWMAIEALTHQIYTSQSDVWSFGILLWEIVTLGSNPYPETPTNMVLQLLKSGYRMEKPENCGNELYNMMLSCWHSRPHRRPNFTQLKHQLDQLLHTESNNEYLNLYDLVRKSNSCQTDSLKLVENKDYFNIYLT